MVLSKIDLVRAWIQLTPHKTAITTPFGIFQFVRIKNAAQTFQREVLHGLTFCYVYIDNLLVASTSPEQHLKLVFECLCQYDIILYPHKCVFVVSNIEYLGHLVDCRGINLLRGAFWTSQPALNISRPLPSFPPQMCQDFNALLSTPAVNS